MCWRGVGPDLSVSPPHSVILLGTAKVGTTQLCNLTVRCVCANVWLVVAFMMCCIYWASFLCGTVVVVVLLLLLLCNDVDLTKEKKHGDLWAFHTFPHRADNCSFNVLYLIFFIISCSFLAFLPQFFDKFYMQLCICPTCICLISLFDPARLYLHNGQLIQVQQ